MDFSLEGAGLVHQHLIGAEPVAFLGALCAQLLQRGLAMLGTQRLPAERTSCSLGRFQRIDTLAQCCHLGPQRIVFGLQSRLGLACSTPALFEGGALADLGFQDQQQFFGRFDLRLQAADGSLLIFDLLLAECQAALLFFKACLLARDLLQKGSAFLIMLSESKGDLVPLFQFGDRLPPKMIVGLDLRGAPDHLCVGGEDRLAFCQPAAQGVQLHARAMHRCSQRRNELSLLG